MPPGSIYPRTKDCLSTEWGVYHSTRAGHDVAFRTQCSIVQLDVKMSTP